MSCCGYHTLKWYYTYPSNPYRYYEIRKPQLVLQENSKPATKESFVPMSAQTVQTPQFWNDATRAWYTPPIYTPKQ
jgi:hypothetical protein